ncbi:unnamed protein product [Blepharisma stoltei]|uniref:Uncharacterized protein n=1 Tax=Blepharisma stoltei TaxID=1481888 RepID=A0AAU9IHM6_9CILI|nr:unnamed protein product [Blepharisma stoltei]
MADPGRIRLLNHRRKEKLKKLLIAELGIERIAQIEQEISNADSLFDQGYDFNQVFEIFKSNVSRNQTPTYKEFPTRPNAGYDEWAGVIKHQDEVQKLADLQHQIEETEKKKRYKEELDQIMHAKQQLRRSIEVRESQEIIRLQQIREKQAEFNKSRENYILQNRAVVARQIQDETISQRQQVLEQQKSMKQREQEEYQRQIDEERKKLSKSVDAEKRYIKSRQLEINNFNLKQLEIKKEEKERERELDRQYTKNAYDFKDAYEEKRQRFLDEFNNFYNKFDELQKSNNFNNITSIEARAKEDELKALEIQRNREEQLKQKEFEKRMSQINSEKFTREILNKQIQERQNALKKQAEEDRKYAQDILEKQKSLSENVIQERIQMREKQKEYLKSLKAQIKNKEIEKRNRYAMNEEERKINREDIEAFQKGALQLHSKVPGYISSPYSMIPAQSSPYHSRGNLELKLYNPSLNQSFSSSRSMTPIRSTSLARYGNNVLKF